MRLLFEVICKWNDTTPHDCLYDISRPSELQRFYNDTFSPLTQFDGVLFEVRGNTYQERKAEVREIAIRYQNMSVGGLSYGELAVIENWFERFGKRYGLLTEFRENGIC